MLACCRRHRAAIIAAIREREIAWRLQGAAAFSDSEQYACRMRACVLQQLAIDLEDEEPRQKRPAAGTTGHTTHPG